MLLRQARLGLPRAGISGGASMPRQKIVIFVVETQSYVVALAGLTSEATCLSLPGLGLKTFATIPTLLQSLAEHQGWLFSG